MDDGEGDMWDDFVVGAQAATGAHWSVMEEVGDEEDIYAKDVEYVDCFGVPLLPNWEQVPS